MHINFPLILVVLTALSGVVCLINKLFFAKKRKLALQKEPWFVDYARSFFPVLLVVLIIRSFLVQPFRVPTGSLEPTILTNEFVVVNQFAYGLRLPAVNTKIVNIGEPKRGDIVVFRWPVNKNLDFIKRVVGVPGDHLVYKNKILYVNGKEMKQTFVRNAIDSGEGNVPVKVMQEDLTGVKHLIYLHADGSGYTRSFDVTVPKGNYFMMGDNRDGSEDSRYWGFVPDADLDGKAFYVWLSWDNQKNRIRWNRLGTHI